MLYFSFVFVFVLMWGVPRVLTTDSLEMIYLETFALQRDEKAKQLNTFFNLKV